MHDIALKNTNIVHINNFEGYFYAIIALEFIFEQFHTGVSLDACELTVAKRYSVALIFRI